MKHPSMKELQAYFENETQITQSVDIKKHLNSCDRCSLVLSQMAKVDILFSRSQELTLSSVAKEKTMMRAHDILLKKREAKSLKAQNIERIKKRNESIKMSAQNKLVEFKKGFFFELKKPLLQATALLIVCGVFTEFSRTTIKMTRDKVINDNVQIYHSEQNLEKDK